MVQLVMAEITILWLAKESEYSFHAKLELLMQSKCSSKDCRFSHILVDVDLRTNLGVDCRPIDLLVVRK